MSQDRSYTRTERYEAIVIGGGEAGLAAASALQARDVDYMVLDPGTIAPPRERAMDPAVSSAAHAAYAAHFTLALRLGVSVRSLRRVGAHFEILAGDLRYEAASVIVALGPTQTALDLGWTVEREPCLYFLGNVAGDAALIAARIAEE